MHRLLCEKKLSASRLSPHYHIIATKLGIEKNAMGEVQYDEIEKVGRAVMDTDPDRYNLSEVS